MFKQRGSRKSRRCRARHGLETLQVKLRNSEYAKCIVDKQTVFLTQQLQSLNPLPPPDQVWVNKKWHSLSRSRTVESLPITVDQAGSAVEKLNSQHR
jgi:hypothetical protein